MAGAMADGHRLRCLTLNLLNDPIRWQERARLAAQGLARLAPDVIALQEVPLDGTGDSGLARWLADQLGGLAVALCPGTGRRAGREALAVLSRWPVAQHERLEFRSQGRVAQKVRLDHAGCSWTLVNLHLHWGPLGDRVRQAQVRQILNWLSAEGAGLTVLCGDLNALPHHRSVQLLRQRFTWAQPRAGGVMTASRPLPTFPTALWRGPGPAHRLRRATLLGLGALRQRRWRAWEGTLDYILVSPTVRVLASSIVLHEPAAHDQRLCVSDHSGVMADLAAGPR